MLAGRTGEIDGPARQQSQSGKESNVTPPPSPSFSRVSPPSQNGGPHPSPVAGLVVDGMFSLHGLRKWMGCVLCSPFSSGDTPIQKK